MKAWGINMKMTFAIFIMTAVLLTLHPYPLFISTAEAASIVVDGDPSDWEGIPALATNSGTAGVLKASHDDKNLYLLVEGSSLSTTMGSFWLNT
ncbi:DUF4832 domain-containing protein, partial [Clostridium perfringens]